MQMQTRNNSRSKATPAKSKITSFNLLPGRILARKYEVVSQIGSGWESEVYMLRELSTGIERAAKFFFPHRNLKNKTSNFHAKKLHKLRHCELLIRYLTQDSFVYRGETVSFLVSDFVEGEILKDFISCYPAKRMNVFEAIHLLHALSCGMEEIHDSGEYHGDLHSENIIIQRRGIGFKIKLIDFFHWGPPRAVNIHDDVCDLIRIFYDAIGGAKVYAKLPQEAKAICCGLKRTLILKKFRNAGELRHFLETLNWS